MKRQGFRLPSISMEKDITLLGNFLFSFYYEYPDDIEASIKSLNYLLNHLEYRRNVIKIINNIQDGNVEDAVLIEVIRTKANRKVQNQKDCMHFIDRVWKLNLFDIEL